MYLPPMFKENDPAVLHAFMEEHSFATLVTQDADGPFATHLPLLLDRSAGKLLGHFARANPHWQLFDGRASLAIFHGPHAYVSPSWYDGMKPAVPTWNYAVVHASGIPVVRDDATWAKLLLAKMVEKYEQPRATPWPYVLPEDFTNAMLKQIIAFEMPIAKLEGKFKLSQNRSEIDRSGVIAGLQSEGGADVVDLMRSHG